MSVARSIEAADHDFSQSFWNDGSLKSDVRLMLSTVSKTHLLLVLLVGISAAHKGVHTSGYSY